MEPYQELEEEYENDDSLDPAQNKKFRSFHRKYKFLLTLYYRVVKDLEELKRENEALRDVDQERMNKFELRLSNMESDVKHIIKTLDKIDGKSTFIRNAIITGLISLLGSLAVGLVMFAVNN